ncbi:MAG: hypothetical protein K2M87_02045 [Muribaculaceae bacterium]|nr:hypothetical protein [Muribaculaceae bacterium]
MEIILWLGIVLLAGFLITYIWGENKTRKNVKIIQKRLAEEMMTTVSAGSHYKEIPPKMRTVSAKYNLFKSSSGQPLNTSAFDSYLVQGNSMQYCDIHPGDIVFAQKGFRLSDLTKFPSAVILKNLKANKNQCQFKIRRAWTVCPDNLEDEEYIKILTEVMNSPEYLNLKDKAKNIYESDDKMLEGFMKKLEEYRANRDTESLGQSIVISSTYDVDNKKIRFSIHRTSSLMGIVKYVVSVSNTQAA